MDSRETGSDVAVSETPSGPVVQLQLLLGMAGTAQCIQDGYDS